MNDALKDAQEDAEVLGIALHIITTTLNELVGACMGADGKPVAPPQDLLMKARGYLPKGYSNAFPAKKNKGQG